MSYAVRAYRDKQGNHGIVIGTVAIWGYDNIVAEFEISEAEMKNFIAACQAARLRAREATGYLFEPLPGAYESEGWMDEYGTHDEVLPPER